MNKRLNIDVIRGAMERAGFNNCQLADKLTVSRTIVGDWLANNKFPRPDKLVRLGLALKLSLADLVVDDAPISALANFRKKHHRKIGEEHTADAVKKAILLDSLSAYLPEEPLEVPPVLKNPSLDYEYVQRAARLVRKNIGKSVNEIISFEDLINVIKKYDVGLIPVFWGEAEDRSSDANGLYVESPKTHKDWIYINLDSNLLDFKFWLSHEIGHVITKHTCEDDFSEEFAELFAQSFLFPEEMADKVYEDLIILRGAKLVNGLIKIASSLVIHPYTIWKSVNSYAAAHGKEALSSLVNNYGRFVVYTKKVPTVINALCGTTGIESVENQGSLSPGQYVELTEKFFDTPVFGALRKLLTETSRSDGFLQSLLSIQPIDAKELHYYLTH